MNTKKTYVSNRLDCMLETLSTIMDSIVKLIEGHLYDLLTTYYQRTLIIHNNSRLAPKLDGLDLGFF